MSVFRPCRANFFGTINIWSETNPFIKSPLLILEAFRHHLFLDSFSGHYRPVQNISYIFDYFFWNTNSYGFHLTNVLLHVASALLLYGLLRKLFAPLIAIRSKAEWSAFLIALLWMVHPVHSAAIDYVSGRADSLAFLFACGAWLLVLCARDARRRSLRVILYSLAPLAGLLALCSREIAGVWLLLFLLHSLFFERNLKQRAKFVSAGVCLLLFAAYLGLRHLPEPRPGPGPSNSFPAPMRAVLMLRALGDYGRLMIFPSNLHMERTVFDGGSYHDRASWRNSVSSEYLSLLGLIVLGALLYGSFRKGNGQPVRVLGASWFLLGYLPISNIVDLGATVAEHWLYLPSVGFLIFLAGCAIDLPARYQRMAGAFCALAFVGLSVRSAIRSSDWITPETFFKRTLASGGMSTRVAVNLGQIYADEGRLAESEKIFRKVLSISPDYPFARNDLAEVLYRQGKKEEADAIFRSARKDAAVTRKTYALTWISILNLARVRHEESRDDEALAILDKARHDYPKVWNLVGLEADILRQKHELDRAEQILSDFARNNWWHYGAAIALGRLYAEKNDVARADAALLHASRLDIHDAEALNLLANIDLRQHRIEEACKIQRRAVKRQPDQPRQYLLLSKILEQMGRPQEARASTAEAHRLEHLALAEAVPN